MPALSPTTSSRRAKTTRRVAVAAALAVAAIAAPSAGAAPAGFSGISGDGSIAFFTTTDKLATGDTDSRADVYARFFDDALGSYVTRAVSTGPTGGNDAIAAQYGGASADGAKVVFSTDESLVAGDTDKRVDVYVRDLATSTTALVSRGAADCAAQGCGNGAEDAGFVPGGVVPDGEEVFFLSAERLSSSDEDGSLDLYARDLVAGTTTLVSAGDASCAGTGCGNGAFGVVFRGAASGAAGTRAFFTTAEALVGADADSLSDLYRRDLTTGTTALVSTAGSCPAPLDCRPAYGGASSDGDHVFFETDERIAAGDTDSSQDVYDWSGGVATPISIGPDGGNGAQGATFSGASSDGAAVFFQTNESLVSADTDSSQDVYERSGGSTTLLSTGPTGGNGGDAASFLWSSPDGSTVLISTAESLTSADTDSSQDVYERSGGSTTLLSTGPTGGNGSFNAGFAGVSGDGSHVFYITSEQLVSADTDASPDIYETSGGTTTLVSTGPVGGNRAFSAGLPAGAIAGDGSHAFFITDERMTVDDLDAETDVYDRSASGTLLVSVGNTAPVGPPTPSGLTTDPLSPGESTTPRIQGQSDPNTSIKIYATADCSGIPVAIGSSLELGGAGIEATVDAGSTTSFRATATDTNGDTSPCSAPVSYTQQSAPPPPPPPSPPSGDDSGDGGGSGGSAGAGGAAGALPQFYDGGIPFVTPKTRITFGPAFKTRKRRVVFRFVDSTGQPGTRFICEIDRRRWRRCGSPKRLKKLKRGKKHVFKVKAVNAAGTWERRPVKRRFKLVRR
jgi:hypothetical protein